MGFYCQILCFPRLLHSTWIDSTTAGQSVSSIVNSYKFLEKQTNKQTNKKKFLVDLTATNNVFLALVLQLSLSVSVCLSVCLSLSHFPFSLCLCVTSHCIWLALNHVTCNLIYEFVHLEAFATLHITSHRICFVFVLFLSPPSFWPTIRGL